MIVRSNPDIEEQCFTFIDDNMTGRICLPKKSLDTQEEEDQRHIQRHADFTLLEIA